MSVLNVRIPSSHYLYTVYCIYSWKMFHGTDAIQYKGHFLTVKKVRIICSKKVLGFPIITHFLRIVFTHIQ